jgi:choline dehydrogenase
VAASQEAGIPFSEDHNGADLDGVGFAQLTIRDGVRDGTAAAFLRPLIGSENLTVLTGARARRLVLDGARCTGVEIERDGALESIHAEHEVVVSCGTIESPKLLLLSGIGDGAELRRLGIEVRSHLPGVGKNLQDHVLSPVVYAAGRPVPPPLPGLQLLHGHLFARSRPGLVAPDLQPLFFHVPAYLEEAGMSGPPDGFTLLAGLIRPVSRGTLTLASADPEEPPLVDPAYLSRGADVEGMVAAIELCRGIGRQPALAEWKPSELYPGDSVTTREELRDYVRRTAITYHHQAGTCRMGLDELAVVDPELRVYGFDGLRVADASVMPFVTSGNTHAPAVMIGERAAELVARALGAGLETAAAS